MMKKFFLLTLWIAGAACVATAATKYVGGDISLLTKYEEHGATYYNNNGVKITDMLSYLKQSGLNAMRVRLFVDPSQAGADDQGEGVCQDLPYVKALGKRIKAAGFNFMLDIHYSDTWTDPAQHSTPASWTVTSALADSCYSYTARVLKALIAADATPDFIQVGNEVTYGMLWPTGHCYPSGSNYGTSGTFNNFASYLKQGIAACRAICPDAQIIVHTEMSKTSNVTSFYKTLKSYTDDFDIIGLSYYPYWHGELSTLNSLLTTLESSYPAKKIQIVETGYPHAYYPSGATYDTQSTWAATEAGQLAFTQDLIDVLNSHTNVNGLYWWFPEANEYGIDYSNCVTTSWYNCGLWDNSTGQVMDALFELKNFLDDDDDEPGDDPVVVTDTSIYIVGGSGSWSLTQPLGSMTNMGNGIHQDTLTIDESIYFVFADGGPDVWDNNWTTFNGTHRYGPSATTTVTTGQQYSTAKRSNNYSYYFTGDGSDYLFTFDSNALTFNISRVEAHSGDEVLMGDVNGDGVVDITDVTTLIDYVLGSTPTPFVDEAADLTADGIVDISDVTSLIDLVLAGG